MILDWATRHEHVVLTHDLSTMISAMQRRMQHTAHCAPILLVPDSLPTGLVIEEILLLDECSIAVDWTAGAVYLPLG